MERSNNLTDFNSNSCQVARINLSKLFKLTFFSSFLMLITVYLIMFYGITFFLSHKETSQVIEQQEQSHLLYKYRNLIFASSLVPSLLLGAFQIKITQLINRQGFDELFFVIAHRKGHMVMYYLFAIVYCVLAVLVACYAIIWDKTLGNEPLSLSEETLAPEGQPEGGAEGGESTLETDARLFLMSQSQINDMLLYIPAALQGILYIIHMREIESAFIDASVAGEHLLLPPSQQSELIGIHSKLNYSQTPLSSQRQSSNELEARDRVPSQLLLSAPFDNSTDANLTQTYGNAELLRTTTATTNQSPSGSYVINLTDMVKDFELKNRQSMQQPINYESSDGNTEMNRYSNSQFSSNRPAILQSANIESDENE